jgi:hypothetical protein
MGTSKNSSNPCDVEKVAHTFSVFGFVITFEAKTIP